MSRLINILFLSALTLTVSFSMTSCNGAKSYVKKAKKMEEAGMIDQAATISLLHLGKNRIILMHLQA